MKYCMESLKNRIALKFKYSFQGFRLLINDPAVKIQLGFSGIAIILSFLFHFNGIEWCLVLFSCGFVIVCEMINTVIEKMLDFIYPEYHEMVGKMKDMAAGFVLMSSICALFIGCILFGGKLLWVLPLIFK